MIELPEEQVRSQIKRKFSLDSIPALQLSDLYAAQALAGKGKDDEIAKEYKEYLKEAPDSILAPRVKDALAQLKPK